VDGWEDKWGLRSDEFGWLDKDVLTVGREAEDQDLERLEAWLLVRLAGWRPSTYPLEDAEERSMDKDGSRSACRYPGSVEVQKNLARRK
jgi:hypothetical protein